MARVAFFAFDINEAAQLRRIRSIRSLGHDVVSLSFRRENMTRNTDLGWSNVDLGQTENQSYARRVIRIGQGIVRAARQRATLADCDVWIARNIDLLIIAWAVRLITRRRDALLVYECLDIHSLMTRTGPVGATLRWVERRLLRRTDLLIISSPGFLRHYFEPTQEVTTPVALIENKLWFDDPTVPRPAHLQKREGPLVFGWVGSLRCQQSLRLLADTATLMGDEVQLVFHGNVHRHAVPDFDAVVEAHPNITYHGPYEYPGDLGGIYGSCDLVWAQDLWQIGSNSDWLLPNRIYEASYFGCPSIALAGTETGRRVSADRLGVTVEKPTADALIGLLQSLTRGDIATLSDGLLRTDDRAFRLDPSELASVLEPVLPLIGAKPEGARRASYASHLEA